MCNCYMYAYSFIYMYIYSSYAYIYMCVCVLKLQKNLKSIEEFIFTALKLNQPARVIKNFSIRIAATSAEDF